ncbi:MAG: pantetheine-phosphate adenylyltransferase [Chloroflexota bacterium]|nr:pantetheine-phosphate adenylyltransferase [Chloroflexota bacterium]
MTLAIYPASFDPVTNGHVDIAARASRLFDELVVAAFHATSKSNRLFTTEERLEMLQDSLRHLPNVRVESYTGLTAYHAREIGANVIVRGLRTVSDFEWELQLTQNYRTLVPGMEIVCLMTSQNYSFMSSSMVKEIARFGGDITGMVPPQVAERLYTAYGITK